MKKIFKIFIIVFLTILFVNVFVYYFKDFPIEPLDKLNNRGFVLKFPMFKYVMIFAHGNYHLGFQEEYHQTLLYGNFYKTSDLIENLRSEGYQKIWTTMCYTGDHDYMYYNFTSGEKLMWPNYVSRKTTPGQTFPVWIGVWFLRF